jgi:hypothetical protein
MMAMTTNNSIKVKHAVYQIPGTRFDELAIYPFWAVLSGLATFIVGSHFWGYSYTFGVAFFAAALLMHRTFPHSRVIGRRF